VRVVSDWNPFSGQELFFGFCKDDHKTSVDVMRSNSCSSWPIASLSRIVLLH